MSTKDVNLDNLENSGEYKRIPKEGAAATVWTAATDNKHLMMFDSDDLTDLNHHAYSDDLADFNHRADSDYLAEFDCEADRLW